MSQVAANTYKCTSCNRLFIRLDGRDIFSHFAFTSSIPTLLSVCQLCCLSLKNKQGDLSGSSSPPVANGKPHKRSRGKLQDLSDT